MVLIRFENVQVASILLCTLHTQPSDAYNMSSAGHYPPGLNRTEVRERGRERERERRREREREGERGWGEGGGGGGERRKSYTENPVEDRLVLIALN